MEITELRGKFIGFLCEGECARVFFLGVIPCISVKKPPSKGSFSGVFYGGPKAVGLGCDGAIAVPRVKSVEGVWS